MKKVTIYTDGACSGNPGIGGWAAVLMYNDVKKEISGYDKSTTNNRMELFAVIQALRCLNQSCNVDIFLLKPFIKRTCKLKCNSGATEHRTWIFTHLRRYDNAVRETFL